MKKGQQDQKNRQLVFRLEGLHCSVCALDIERSSAMLDWVEGTSVDPITSKLTLTIRQGSDPPGESLSKIQEIVDGIEPGVRVLSEDDPVSMGFHKEGSKALKSFSARVLPGLLLWGGALTLAPGTPLRTTLFLAA
ncbi:MAG: cation transporter, partial [Synergistaceae bacterium]|nr:cation transporter [Synergistaceae bacterium]